MSAAKVLDPDMFDMPSDEAMEEAEALERFVADKLVARAKRRSIPKATFDRARAEVGPMMSSGDWSGAKATHFVALFEIRFEEVYGVAPSLSARDRKSATFAAARLLAERFAGDQAEMASFVRWYWRREEGREQYRRKNQKEGGVARWQFVFRADTVAEFMIDRSRTQR